MGTIGYAAPEQIRGERVDARCDVYALGCVLYRMVAGTVPFQACADRRSLVRTSARLAPRSRGSRCPASPPTSSSRSTASSLARWRPIPRNATRRQAILGTPPSQQRKGVPGHCLPAASRGRRRARAGRSSSASGRGRNRSCGDPRPPFRAGLTAIAVLVIAAAAGALLALSDDRRPGPPPSKAVSTARMLLRVPADWRRLDRRPRLAGIAFRDDVALAAPDLAGPTVVAGMVDKVTDPALLPLERLEIDGRLPQPDVVALGSVGALRYRAVRLTAVDRPATLYAVPTDRGVATIACIAAARRGMRATRSPPPCACAALARSHRVRP